MIGNGKVFVSHAHADEALVAPLFRALSEWELDTWYDKNDLRAGDVLNEQIVVQIGDRDILIRASTPAARHSSWMERELWLAEALATIERHNGQLKRRMLNIVFSTYEPGESEQAKLFIDARNRPEIAWLDELRRTLELPERPVRFAQDDAGYHWWLGHYTTGFVLNVDWYPKANSYCVLHRATCHQILMANTTSTPKVCSEAAEKLQAWARDNAAGPVQRCTNCP